MSVEKLINSYGIPYHQFSENTQLYTAIKLLLLLLLYKFVVPTMVGLKVESEAQKVTQSFESRRAVTGLAHVEWSTDCSIPIKQKHSSLVPDNMSHN